MTDYRCYLIDQAGHFVDVEEFDCPTDAGALLLARAFVKAQPGWNRFELWRGDHMIRAAD